MEFPTDRCPVCNTIPPPEAPPGFCPVCELRRALEIVPPPVPTPVSLPEDAAWAGGHPGEPASKAAPGPGPLGTVGDYELFEEIGRGGMGVVYRAWQRSLGRWVALKRLLLGPRADPGFSKRFRAEASAAASLRHPNIVAIHEVGVHQGEPYLVMELVDGPPLHRLVRDRALPARRAADFVRAIAEATHHAHQRGLLHRDIKPSNILVDSDGRPRLTDFGLAKRFREDSDAAPPETQMTMAGQLLGSPCYMPPEQAGVIRAPVDRRSDVYALGATLYHLLTGRPPFGGGTLADTLGQLAHQEPVAPRLLDPTIPRDLESLCLACLEKEPHRRYPSAQALADDLVRFLGDEPTRARPVGPVGRIVRGCRRRPAFASVAGSALLLLSILGIGGPVAVYRIDLERRRAATEESARAEQLYAADMRDADQNATEGEVAGAGRLLALHRPQTGQPDRRGFEWWYLQHLNRGQEMASWATTDGHTFKVSFSPGGRWVAGVNALWESPHAFEVGGLSPPFRPAFLLPTGRGVLAFVSEDTLLTRHRGRELALWSPFRDGEQVLLRDENVRVVALADTGGHAATGSNLGLRVWNRDTWGQVAHEPTIQYHWWTEQGLAFSRDGRWLVTATGGSISGHSVLAFWEIPSLARLPGPRVNIPDVTTVAFSADGREFYTGSADGTLRTWDSATRTKIEERRQPRRHRSWISRISVPPAGDQIATAGSDRTIVLGRADRHAGRFPLHGHSREIWSLEFSSDGRILASVDNLGVVMLWRAGPTLGSHSPDELNDGGRRMQPLGLSADGRVLATLTGTGLKFWDTRAAPLAEIPSRRWDYPSDGLRWDPASGEDGTAIGADLEFFAVARTNRPTELWNLRNRSVTRLENSGPRAFPLFSPDGRQLAAPVGPKTVALWNVADGRLMDRLPTPRPIQVEGIPLAFSGDARILAVALDDQVIVREIGSATVRTPIRVLDPFAIALSTDGGLLAIGFESNQVRLFDTRTGLPSGIALEGHVASVQAIAFSPDGRTLFTGSDDGRLWHIPTQRVMIRRAASSMVTTAFFDRHGELLVTGERGQRVLVWRAPR